jgi:glycosyltransferase involved in cell wall biosynthesis
MTFSILILTLNEEANLPACLKAVEWCDDIVVLDCFSQDRSTEIAAQFGARVFQRKFDDFASQRNFALETVSFKYPWIFHLDADELFTPELRSEVESKIEQADCDAYFVPSKMIMHGKWLRHAGLYPSYQVRLTRLKAFRFKQVGHGQREDIEGSRIGRLSNPYIHNSFSKGLGDWIDRHNRYSTLEAQESLKEVEGQRFSWAGVFAADSIRRRRALKYLSYRMPFRPFLRFVYMYFIRMGFLDGVQGWIYCSLLAMYESMIAMKKVEVRRAVHKDNKISK